MKRMSNDRACFLVSLEEVKKYGLSPLEQLKGNPEDKRLFPKKKRGEKEIAKRNDLLRRSIPSLDASSLPNAPTASYLLY